MALGSLGTLSVDIQANIRRFNQNMSQVQSSLSNTAERFKQIGANLTKFVTLPILGVGVASVKLASDFEESMNKVNVVFKDNASEIDDWSKTTLKSFGIAQGTALEMVSLFGDMSTSMGLTTEEASNMSRTLVGLAGDLASFKNIRIEEAETALQSIYTGETESLKMLGIVMTQANLERFAMNKGIQKSIQDMTEAEKVNLRYNFVLEKTKSAHGDFSRTGAGAANQMRIFTESLKELGEKMGNILLPIATKLITKVNSIISWFGNLNVSSQKIIVVIAGIVAAIGPLLIVLGTIITLAPAIGAAFTFMTGPIGLVIVAIGLLVTNAIILYKKWDTIKDKIKMILLNLMQAFVETFEKIRKIVFSKMDKILQDIELFGSVISKIFPSISDKISTLRTKFEELDKKFTTANIQAQLDIVNAKQKLAIEIEDKKNKKLEESKKKEKELVEEQEKRKTELDNLFKSTNDYTKGLDKNIDAVEELKRKTINAYEDIGTGVIDALRNMYNKRLELEEKSINKSISMASRESRLKINEYNKVFVARSRALSNETKESLSAVQKQIDSINKLTEDEERELEKQEFAKTRAEKEKRIQEEISNEKRKKLQEELNNFILNRERNLILQRRRDVIESLRNEMDDIREQADKKQEQLQAEFDAQKANEEAIAKRKEGHLKALLSKEKHYHSENIKEENLEAEARKMIIDNNQVEIVDLIKSYNPKWRAAGKSLGEKLLQGISSVEARIKAKISSLMSLTGGTGFNIPQYQTGTNYVPNDGLAYLHKGEAVIPASQNKGRTGNGITINVTGNTISNGREADKLATTIVSKLRMAGVNP